MKTEKITSASYGYRSDMTNEELRQLAETLNYAQLTELGRLLDLEAKAHNDEAVELGIYRDSKFGRQAANGAQA